MVFKGLQWRRCQGTSLTHFNWNAMFLLAVTGQRCVAHGFILHTFWWLKKKKGLSLLNFECVDETVIDQTKKKSLTLLEFEVLTCSHTLPLISLKTVKAGSPLHFKSWCFFLFFGGCFSRLFPSTVRAPVCWTKLFLSYCSPSLTRCPWRCYQVQPGSRVWLRFGNQITIWTVFKLGSL